MLPIHAFVADVDCPPDISAADRFAEVGTLFIGWVEGAFAEDVPGFMLPENDTAEPVPGHVVRVESANPAPSNERFRIVWRQPWLLDGSECVQEYAVARAGNALSASVLWHLTSAGPISSADAQPDRPAILTRLLPFVAEAEPPDRHPLDGLVRRDRGAAFRAVEAVLVEKRELAEQERAALFDLMEQDNLALAAERKELRREVKDLTETVHEQRSQLLALGGRRRSGKAADGFEREASAPESVAEAVERVKGEFPNELLFLKSADDSAADSPYQYPHRVYELLHALGDIARRWRTNTLNMEWKAAFEEADPQFVYKPHLSQTTATNNWEDYAFQYDGAKRLFEPHVSLGKSHDPKKCLSVHWYRDEDAKRVVVGWCGRHRPNTKT